MVFIGILLITLITIFLSFYFRPLVADDYCLSVEVNKYRNDFYGYLDDYRNGVNGRLMPSILYFFCFSTPNHNLIYRSLTFLMFLLLVVSIIGFVKKEDQELRCLGSRLFLPILFSIWMFAPGLGQSLFWDNSSAVYLWGTVFVIGSLFFSKVFFETRRMVQLPFILIAVLVSATFLEQAMPAVLFFFFAAFIRNSNRWGQKRHLFSAAVFPVLFSSFSLFGTLIILSSSANIHRTSALGDIEPHSFISICQKFYDYSSTIVVPFLMVTLLAILIYGLPTKGPAGWKSLGRSYIISGNPFLVMSILSLLPFYLTGLKISASRTQFLPFVFFLIFVFKLFNDLYLDQKFHRYIRLMLAVILLVDSINAFRSNYYYFRVTETILQETGHDTKMEAYERISALHRTTYLSEYDPKNPKSFWIKNCIEEYKNIK